VLVGRAGLGWREVRAERIVVEVRDWVNSEVAIHHGALRVRGLPGLGEVAREGTATGLLGALRPVTTPAEAPAYSSETPGSERELMGAPAPLQNVAKNADARPSDRLAGLGLDASSAGVSERLAFRAIRDRDRLGADARHGAKARRAAPSG
jgi:hypothetical protein